MGSQQTAQVDKLLTEVSNKIVPDGFVSEEILPMVKVKQSTGKLGSYGSGHMRIVTTLTGGKTNIHKLTHAIIQQARTALISMV